MKQFFSFGIVGILLLSCSKKEGTSDVPDLSNMQTQPTSAPAESTTSAKPELKKEGDINLPGYAMINSSDCLTCHKSDERLVGPSYEEVAKKYSVKDVEMLADKILKGGKGVWGQTEMTPHPQLTKDEAKQMVEYILTLKR